MTDKLIVGLGIAVLVVGVGMIIQGSTIPSDCYTKYIGTFQSCVGLNYQVANDGFVVLLMGLVTAIIGKRMRGAA